MSLFVIYHSFCFSISIKALGLVALMKFMGSVHTGVAPIQTYELKI